MTMCDLYKMQIILLLACRIAVRLSSVIAGSVLLTLLLASEAS